MKIIKLLWIVVFVLLLILLFKPKEETKIIADGLYENCYVLSLKEKRMTAMMDGKMMELPCPVEVQTEIRDKIADILVKGNQITKITWKEGMVTDKIDALSLEEGWMNLGTYGKKSIAAKGALYIKTGNQVRMLKKAGILLNREKADFFIFDGEICAVVVEGEGDKQNIRVLLHGPKNEIYHEKVRVTASAPYKVRIDKEESSHEAGEEILFEKDMGRASVVCPDGKIKILSMERSYGCPEYDGTIIVNSYEEGYVVRNELKLEEYLKSVVSSEMPSTYPEEALKAQAVCARTYALYQMEQAYYSEYGAHVDDTVNSQVYNNVKETDSTKKAVNDTTGQYLSYEDAPICAYFYSTSCGITSDVKDVWIGDGMSPVYLTGKFQGEKENSSKEEVIDLSKEEKFKEFIESVPNNAFEKKEAWFRWKGTFSYEALTDHVEKNMESWLKSGPSHYRLELKDSNESNELNKGIGKILKVEVTARSKGGVIKEIRLTGEKGMLTVTGEYQIRKVLCPSGTAVELKDGSIRKCNMLPSGYVSIENGEKIFLQGGGYGHGVGMSQNGAGAMAQLEYGYEEILAFYYPETELLEMY